MSDSVLNLETEKTSHENSIRILNEEMDKTLDENTLLKSKVVSITNVKDACYAKYKELAEKNKELESDLRIANNEKEVWRSKYNLCIKGYNH